ncbi:glycosyltransferase [Acidobacteriota bacterium]
MSSFTSVIVCTYRHPQLMKRLLVCLTEQTASKEAYEIIAVFDKHELETRKICRAMQDRLPNLRIVLSPGHTTLAGAINIGVHHARGNYLIFTDDDCLPHQDWVSNMTAALQREPLVMGAITSPTSEYVKLSHNVSHLYRWMPGRRAGPMPFLAGATMGFRRSVFNEIGGFFPDSKNNDMDFLLKARSRGYRVYFDPKARIAHDPDRNTLRAVFGYTYTLASNTIVLRQQHKKLMRTPFVLRSSLLLRLASPFIAFGMTVKIFFGNISLIRYVHTAPLVFAMKITWCWGAAAGLARYRGGQSSTEGPKEDARSRNGGSRIYREPSL